jgi:hypothetical protein
LCSVICCIVLQLFLGFFAENESSLIYSKLYAADLAFFFPDDARARCDRRRVREADALVSDMFLARA